jgi:hypothetical protein
MGTGNEHIRMRSMDLNEPLTITLPAHIWHGFMVAYGDTEWINAYASAVLVEVQERLLDPVWLKERLAAHQRDHSTQDRLHNQLLSRFGIKLPEDEVPPDAGELQ